MTLTIPLDGYYSAVLALLAGRIGQGGAFLFGAFSAADAMYAPVVNRLHVYDAPVAPDTRAYMVAMMALPAWREWEAGAEAEPWAMLKYDSL